MHTEKFKKSWFLRYSNLIGKRHTLTIKTFKTSQDDFPVQSNVKAHQKSSLKMPVLA
jgi:hypothetical protein